MNQSELLSIFFTLFLGVGIVLNYNLIYATVHKKSEWRMAGNLNKQFLHVHEKLGAFTYALATIWYLFWSHRFETQGLWFTSMIVDAYLLTRIAAWIVLSRRAALTKQRSEMAKLGPDGSHVPVGLSNTSNSL